MDLRVQAPTLTICLPEEIFGPMLTLKFILEQTPTLVHYNNATKGITHHVLPSVLYHILGNYTNYGQQHQATFN